jgi:hemoglobin
MEKAHEGMNIQPIHFDAIMKHLRDALAHFGVSKEDIHAALSKVETLRDDIIYK